MKKKKLDVLFYFVVDDAMSTAAYVKITEINRRDKRLLPLIHILQWHLSGHFINQGRKI